MRTQFSRITALALTGAVIFGTATPVFANHRGCYNCGVVREAYRERGEDRRLGGGTVIGALAGAAIGNQVGKGDGRKAATVAGALAGGAVGHNVEKRHRRDRTYWHVEVSMDNGGYRVLNMRNNRQSLRPGDRVVVRNGEAYLLR
ncbi:glycine zipper 2TM domain-containing protein [Tahibacter amnicola]|uniref:Glycine zipper 2TM domain-containing protein n=1 Tax=Tahibacter amnicola TaxID=2976241 RepID=A0ABY6B9F9_9GAMM|nr:glycine zipper 2TM domain-containing protein [Tahibacter amnicola]UXI66698.1 glycine zipper 2TM domain-containing protein [Tahibacter amnicola]